MANGKPFMLVSEDQKLVRMLESEEAVPVQQMCVMLTKALMTLVPLAIAAGPEEPPSRIVRLQ